MKKLTIYGSLSQITYDPPIIHWVWMYLKIFLNRKELRLKLFSIIRYSILLLRLIQDRSIYPGNKVLPVIFSKLMIYTVFTPVNISLQFY